MAKLRLGRLVRDTERLRIRPLGKDDYSAWKAAQFAMAPPMNPWDIGPRKKKDITPAKFKDLLHVQAERRSKDVYYSLGVFDQPGRLVGMVSLMEVIRGISQTAFLGYRIFNNHWGKGYGKEAVGAVLEIGFKDLKLHRVEAGIEPGNARSIRLAKSFKMRCEGLKKRAIFLGNKWVDLRIYALTSEDVDLKYPTRKLKRTLTS